MKKLFLAAIFMVVVLMSGCTSTDSWVMPLTMTDFNGTWHLEGTFDQNIEGRMFTTPLDTLIYIREGGVTDAWGYAYNHRLRDGILTLSRDFGFEGRDDYCGYFEGGSPITFTIPNVNPDFDQTYTGSIEGETAVFTQFCNYKPMVITGTVWFTKIPMI